MGTVSKSIADAIKRGEYASDNPTRIVKYTNAWGGEAYGVTFGRDDKNKYMVSGQYISNPQIYWEADTPERSEEGDAGTDDITVNREDWKAP